MTTKACSKCNRVLVLGEFNKDMASADGRKSFCKHCQREYQRSEEYKEGKRARQRSEEYRAWKRDYRQSEAYKAYDLKYRERPSERQKIFARDAVNNAIKTGQLCAAASCLCADCGHVAQEYHHGSYTPDAALDVVPLCRRCHAARHNGGRK